MLVLRGKTVELAEAEPMEPFQQVEHRRVGDEGASLPPVDGSDAASLPKAPDEKPMEVKVPLVQVRAPLRSMEVKRQANRRR